jgi:hypothetical protein
MHKPLYSSSKGFLCDDSSAIHIDCLCCAPAIAMDALENNLGVGHRAANRIFVRNIAMN